MLCTHFLFNLFNNHMKQILLLLTCPFYRLRLQLSHKDIRWPAKGHTIAKLPQSCPTLCDPIDSSPPGYPVPGILQARTLEWVAISFSYAWKWKVKEKSRTDTYFSLKQKFHDITLSSLLSSTLFLFLSRLPATHNLVRNLLMKPTVWEQVFNTHCLLHLNQAAEVEPQRWGAVSATP